MESWTQIYTITSCHVKYLSYKRYFSYLIRIKWRIGYEITLAQGTTTTIAEGCNPEMTRPWWLPETPAEGVEEDGDHGPAA